MGAPKLFKRGETIYKAGDPIEELYLVQSGLASVSVSRGGKVFEICQVGANQVLGEEALWGMHTWSGSAVANNDVKAAPIPIQEAAKLLGEGSQLVKVYTRAVLEKHRVRTRTLEELKTENDPTPCAPDRITRLFATIHTVASYTGTQKNGACVVVWPAFKKYCQRTFLESPVRLEQAVQLLVKVGHAKLEMIPCETDPEAPDELGYVHFTDLDKVKAFYEFYRKYQFSGPKGKAPRPDETQLTILREIEAWNQAGKV